MSNIILSDLIVKLAELGFTGGTAPTGALLAVNNLNDVNNKQTSRTNLQVARFTTFAGNPNGNVAGVLGDWVLDTVDSNSIWYCVTAGTTTTAVWIQPGGVSGVLQVANNLNDVASKVTSRANLGVSAITSYAGNPNGNVAGVINDWVRDITNQTMWICTTTGTASTAVWEQTGGQGDLLSGNNLLDVQSIDSSRQNLNSPKINNHAGDPNGHVAGIALGDLCLNTQKSALYVCTTTGTAPSAVWVPVINQAQKFVDNATFNSTFGLEVGSTPTPLPVGEISSDTTGSTWTTVGDNYGMKCGQAGSYFCNAYIPLGATGLGGGQTWFYLAVNGVKATKSFPMGNIGTQPSPVGGIVFSATVQGILNLNFGDIVTVVGITNSVNPLIVYYNSPDSDGISCTFLRQN